ncbi:MAG: cell division protein FtsQ/DivIB [Christensenellales bacterium]|jgi:cell division septal protein FtsQ
MSDADFTKHSMVPPSGGNGAPQMPIEPLDEDNQPSISPRLKFAVRVISILVISISIAFILRETVFTINNVAVVGNINIPNEIVLSSAGINSSSNFFNVNEDEIARNIDSNRYLKYLSMEKRFPNGLTIYVKERIPAACINYIGIMYILADDGVVLETTKSSDITGGLVSITGLDIQNIHVGSLPEVRKIERLASCIDLLRELIEQGVINNVSLISFTDTNIYLSLRDNYTVNLGDGNYLRAKIGTARGVLIELRKQNLSNGIIEATKPGEATFRPEN